MKKNPYSDLFTPRAKKTTAKKVVQKAAAKAAEETVEKTVEKALAITATKTVARTGSKVVGKTFLRTAANPWLLAADGVELGVAVACNKLDLADRDARRVSKGAGLVSSTAIGVALGGPVGAGAGAAL